MKLVDVSIKNPIGVTVALLLALIFGLISLFSLPIQLTPEIEKPEVSIKTVWRGAAPEEIEVEIIEPQEKVLRGLPGMVDMVAKAQRGQGEITLSFSVDTNLQKALLEVLNRLNRVPRYPTDAEEPILSSVGGESRPIAWFIIKPKADNKKDIAGYQDYVEEVVQTRFERVPGVSLSEVRGGRQKEVRITFDAYKAASLGVQLPVAAALAGSGKDVSGGFVEMGKRRYTLRFSGKFPLDSLTEMVIDWRNGKPVRLRDIAEVAVQYQDKDSFVLQNGAPAMAVNAHRETGVNVLKLMAGLKAAAQELQEGPLQRAQLNMHQVYDETLYIDQSIGMVSSNLMMGIVLAVLVLWWFLRNKWATFLIAMVIPVCVVVSFIFLQLFGRTLNVISLAGVAFATGMVVDAAIVVLENIMRRRQLGQDSYTAAYQGTSEVWLALLASTATTVAIFLPVVFLRDEAGQLFADLAIAIAASVSISLVVAIMLLPAATNNLLKNVRINDPHEHWWEAITNTVMRWTNTPKKRGLLIVGLILSPVLITFLLWMKPDYLPEGNRNLVFAFILPPPGSNVETLEKELGQVIAERMRPYIEGSKSPQVSDYFFVAFPRGVFMGARAKNEAETTALVPLVNSVIQGFPDTIAFAKRASLFGGLGEGNTINVDIQGRDIESVLDAAAVGFGAINEALPGASVRPLPGLSLSEPELRLIPDERRIAEAGWNRDTLSGIIRALGDGLFVGDYFDGEQRINVVLRGQPWFSTEELSAIPLATPNAGVLPLSELVQVQRTAGPDEIRRINRRRTITLQVTPPEGMALAQALSIIQDKVAPMLEEYLPEDGAIRYSGTADKLKSALTSMAGSFILAIVILFLLMSALFHSFSDSLKVMVVIPLGVAGGFITIYAVKYYDALMGVSFQSFNMLTMIGFIILLGIVVNNAILLVDQTRRAERAGMAREQAVRDAVRRRLRPILMTTLTTLVGMLPAIIAPGAGTELYQGLAAVIFGGIAVSTVFTLLLLPSLLQTDFQIYLPAKIRRKRALATEPIA